MYDIIEKIKREREKEQNTKEYRIISLNDFLKIEVKENPFLLKGMIVEGSINALTSDSGKGKSLLMLKMVEAIATGEKFLGEFETKKSKTLIIDLEMSEGDLAQRTQSIIHHEMGGLDFYHAQTFNICDDNDFQWLKNIIVTNEYKLVVLDTYSMAHNKNENDNTETNVVNHKLLELVNEYNITILFLHHHRKLQKGEIMSQSTSRGATDIIGKTASHLLIDSRDIVVVINENESVGGIKLVVEQMKRRQAVGFERFAIRVWYNPNTKLSTFEFDGYDEKAESALDKTKGLILGGIKSGEEYIMSDITEMVGKTSNLYAAMKELVEIEKKISIRLPQPSEIMLGDKKLRSNTKIYYLSSNE